MNFGNREHGRRLIETLIPDLAEREAQVRCGDVTLDEELLQIFVDQFKVNGAGMKLAKSAEVFAREAHSLKGMAGLVGLPELVVLSLALENAAEDEAKRRRLLGGLEEWFRQLLISIEQGDYAL